MYIFQDLFVFCFIYCSGGKVFYFVFVDEKGFLFMSWVWGASEVFLAGMAGEMTGSYVLFRYQITVFFDWEHFAFGVYMFHTGDCVTACCNL